MRLDGKIAIITGAAGGIGRATAIRFAREGCKMALNDILAGPLAETEAMVRAVDGEAISVVGDISRPADAAALIDTTIDRYGCIDILDNNAAFYVPADVGDLSEEDWDRVQDVNVKGTYLCSKYRDPTYGAAEGRFDRQCWVDREFRRARRTEGTGTSLRSIKGRCPAADPRACGTPCP